jgi:hypothetical protein
MTKKQYEKKVRQLQRNIPRYARETGGRRVTRADRVNTPNFGMVIPCGKYEGQTLRSYKQAWDMMYDVLKGTDLMSGIN